MPNHLEIWVTLVPIIGMQIVNIIVAWKTNNKAKVIQYHVNSTSTKQTEKIESLEKEIVSLKQLIATGEKK